MSVRGTLIFLNKTTCGINSRCFSVYLNRLKTKANDSSGTTSSNNKHKIGVCQITCGNDKEANFNVCNKLILDAKNRGAKMVFLPESFDYLETSKENTFEKAESIDGPLIGKYRKIASDNKLWLSLGGFHRKVEVKNEKRLYNSHIVIDDTGEIRQIYDKLHLFEVYLKKENTVLREAEYTMHGQKFHLPLETPFGNLATSICYDLRFPQQSLLSRKLGAQILTYPSVFTAVTGEAHWHILLRARAIETQCYVVAAAQVGQHNEKRNSYGHSLVIDPWGRVLVDCGKKSPHVEVVEIDLDMVNEVRTNMPVTNSYRDDLYLSVPLIKKTIDQPHYNFANIKISNKQVFYESQYSYACVNIKPIVSGRMQKSDNVMVIPKQIRTRVIDMTQDEAADLFITSRLISSILEKHFNCTSLNLSIQDGAEAGQSVPHVHLHIIPRKKGDFRSSEFYAKLRNHDKDLTIGIRSLEEMAKEAAEFRKLFGYN